MTSERGPPGVVLAGTASGVGKTVATLAAIQACEAAGVTVQPAKAGPDFIDPGHHAAVSGRPSRPLDPWLQGDIGMGRNYHRGDGDICLVEGMMELYDGDVSTARLAAELNLPVVLVLDASAGMESLAATALGFRAYARHVDPNVDVAGVLLQRCAGGRHERGVRDALPDGLAYLGRVPPRDDLAIPDRHLGLHGGEEAPLADKALTAAAEHIHVDRLLEIARIPPSSDPRDPEPDTDTQVAVARDAAFRFCYPATIERLRERAEVVTFAPAAGDDLPRCDGVYLPGGYPELHAAVLAESPTLSSLADQACEGLPVLGECGGLMALAETLTHEGTTHEMAGVLPADVTMCEQFQALDHVGPRARRGTLTAPSGARLRGHEFHYSRVDLAADARFVFDVERGKGLDGAHDGLVEHRTLGTYAHVHAASGASDRFLDEL